MSSSGTKELKAEVTIIGRDGSGLTAAVVAAEKGRSKVVVLEKLHVPGGNAL